MTTKQQASIWGAVLIGFLAFIYVLSPILLPFIVGMAVAYLLDPVADRLEKMGLSRLSTTFIILMVFVVLSILFLVAVLPVLVQQILTFVENLPGYLKTIEDLGRTKFDMLISRLPIVGGISLENSATSLLTGSKEIMSQLAKTVIDSTSWFVSILSLLLIAPVVAFYLLRDWDKMVAIVDNALPRDHADTVRRIMSEIDDMMAGFIRGQGLVALILGSFYAIALSVVGLNFGLLIGLVSGLLSFIPYVGSLTGFILATGMAIAQFQGDYLMIGITAGIFIFGQFVEGNFISPKLVGDRVRLHPVWLIFALLAGGYFMGFVGALIAVPVAASIGVLVRFAFEQYYDSKLYKGKSSKDQQEVADGAE